jgi:hypothetical protein
MLALDRVRRRNMAKFKITVSESGRSEPDPIPQGCVMEFANHVPEELRSVTEDAPPLLPLGEDPQEDPAQQQ